MSQANENDGCLDAAIMLVAATVVFGGIVVGVSVAVYCVTFAVRMGLG